MFTPEQQAIIASDADRIRVMAFAGTGKTSTLVGYARARDETMLYVAYNRAIADAARSKLPRNVTCKTAHALAYAVYGHQYKHKLGNMRVGDVADVLRLSYHQAALVTGTVNGFLNSADEMIDARHLPASTQRNNAMECSNVLEGAHRLWKSMQDVEKTKIPMSHDGYLKLYSLSKPNLGAATVMFDEAQDANPAIGHIVLNHPGRLIVTGDVYQGIYGYRGAKDVLTELKSAETFALTRSFRFGRNIARVANHLLGYLGETRQVVGAGQYPDGPLQVDPAQPYCLIARTNMSLIQSAIETLRPRLRSHYVGGVENIGLNLIWDGYQLYRRNREQVSDRFIKKFTSLSALSEYAQQANDTEMGRLCRIVNTYTHRIPELLQQIRALAVDAILDADRTFTTAHRSKGIEFDRAVLSDDFTDLLEAGAPIPVNKIDRQEVHLHYVAATRGIEAMQPSAQLTAFVNHCERRTRPQDATTPALVHAALP